MKAPVEESKRQKELRSIFNRFDDDRSGDVDIKELKNIFHELGISKTEGQICDIVKVAGPDASSLTFEQFEQLFSTSRLLDAFNQYDIDKSGTITHDEIHKAMRSLGYKMSKAQCLAMVHKVDTDGDKEISFAEFEQFFQNVPMASMDELAAFWASSCIVTDCGSDMAPTVPGCGLLWWQTVLAGGCAGVLSRTLTAPLEKIKITAQTGTNGGRTLIRELQAVFASQGLKGLFAGNLTNCIRVFPTAGITCTVYLNLLSLTPADKEVDVMEPVYRMVCAGTAALFANLITYPLDLIRTRITVANGSGLRDIVSGIYSQGGIKSFYGGIKPTLAAVVPFIAMQNASIDVLRDTAMENSYEPTPAVLFSVGCASGIAAQLLVYPLDVVRRRMQMGAAHANANIVADSMWLSMNHLIKSHGWRSLFAGIGPTFIKTIPTVGTVALITNMINGHYKKQNQRQR